MQEVRNKTKSNQDTKMQEMKQNQTYETSNFLTL